MSRRHVVQLEVEMDLADVGTSDLLAELAQRCERPGCMAWAVNELPDDERRRLLAGIVEPPLPRPDRTLYPDWLRERLQPGDGG